MFFSDIRTTEAPNGPGGRVAVALACLAAIGSVAALAWIVRDARFVGLFVAGLAGVGAIAFLAAGRRPGVSEDVVAIPDIALVRAALDRADGAAAVTDGEGLLVAANHQFGDWFAAGSSLTRIDPDALDPLARAARRDGEARGDRLRLAGRMLDVRVSAAGSGESMLLWSFSPTGGDTALDLVAFATGDSGLRFGEAGIMLALADRDGLLVHANPAFAQRATGGRGAVAGTPLVSLIAIGEDGGLRFAVEGGGATPLRVVQLPAGDAADALSLFVLLDDSGGGADRMGAEEGRSVHALLDCLPLGLALVNIDGRIVYLNRNFRAAAGLDAAARPVYPGDLVIDEDKGPLSDAVRRFARGPATSSDLSLRLRTQPDEPVAVTIAGVRGLGEAAVMLTMRDNSEADRLKRQIAQATKMQAVGQLAGGVAHDFNNILTAIIGHCDLMLMRHAPGDSDYDDIQQIRGNSNRAANLTRQLLAFSRQQTLRPQVLQLPDVVSEVSNLLKRLLGESVTLDVRHGRNLGAVRADPGQLEQVIVNLAVNARDAMPEGGTLTIQTYAFSADRVRGSGSEILPVGDYTALRVTDTGTGIPDAIVGKIFEPFFTTKELGKGTGLGLSTVYGIVKQSGGFIFAEAGENGGASFAIYLPVDRSGPAAKGPVRPRPVAGDLWGSGKILLVEDEAMVRTVAERSLARHGYTVLTAESGEAALETLEREGSVDLMISDVVMPVMDGPATARAARKLQADLPILFISGYAEEHLRKSIDLDNVAFLAKPFSVNRLAEAVRDVLQPK